MILGIELTVNLALTIAVFVIVGYRLVTGVRFAARHDGRALIVEIGRGIRWRHIWPIPLVATGVIGVAIGLIQVPGLDWGWWSAIGGVGNPVTGSSTETVGTIWEWLVPLVFLALLAPALPLFAHAEERMFRQGAQNWSTGRRLWMMLKFGLVHALIGIPIGVAIALSIGGAYFMAIYLRHYRGTGSERRATIESARAHTAYNAAILGLALAAVLYDALA